MKIGGIKGGVKSTSSSSRAAKGRGAKGSSSLKSLGRSGSDRDAVEISSHADTLSLIEEIVDAQPDVRVDQVERIVDEMKRGRYKINFEKVAESFIKDAILNAVAKRSKDGV